MHSSFPHLGISKAELLELNGMAVDTARSKLDNIKRRAKVNFRKKALELHPDMNGGDPAKTEQFKELSEGLDFLERMEIKAVSARPRRFRFARTF